VENAGLTGLGRAQCIGSRTVPAGAETEAISTS
jgi:hypothetical protein